jgi:hypothetical protein
MRRGTALLISLVIGVAAIFGTFAATRSVQLGHSSTAISGAQIAARNRALDQAQAKLGRMLAGQRAATHRAAGRHRVVYVRPAPHIVTLHHRGGEAEIGEHDAEAHAGGGFDD